MGLINKITTGLILHNKCQIERHTNARNRTSQHAAQGCVACSLPVFPIVSQILAMLTTAPSFRSFSMTFCVPYPHALWTVALYLRPFVFSFN